jgi:hypothetical protein
MEAVGNVKKHTAKNLKSRFGISLERYAEILKNQGGVCKICEYAPSATCKMLAVDHCHKTGSIRGLLCTYCNTALGLFKDDIKLLKIAIKYLKSKSNLGKIIKGRTKNETIKHNVNRLVRQAVGNGVFNTGRLPSSGAKKQ